MVSRELAGRPLFCRTASNSAACSAAAMIEILQFVPESVSFGKNQLEGNAMSAVRRFPAGIDRKPERISKTLIEWSRSKNAAGGPATENQRASAIA